MDIGRILDVIPHRYPFLLVDRILEVEGTKRIVGIKNVTINEPFFQGHFPGHPIMPGVLIIEAMAQVGGMLLLGTIEDPDQKVVYFMSLDNVKFRRPVLPGRPAPVRARDDPEPGAHLPDEGHCLRRWQRRRGGGDDGAGGRPVTVSVHPTAIIDPTAQLGEGVEIGPWVIVGEQVTIGDRCRIGPRARLERNVRLAEDVSVGDGSILGGDPAGPQVSGRRDLGRDRRRHDHPRVQHDQPRHVAELQDDRRRALLHHELRPPGARLPRRRRGGHRQRHPVRRARDRPRPRGAQRAQCRPPVRHHRNPRLRRRRLPGQPGHPAVREGGGKSDGALRAQLGRIAARGILRATPSPRSSAPIDSSSTPSSTSRRRSSGPAPICRRSPRSSTSSSSSPPPSGACRHDGAAARRGRSASERSAGTMRATSHSSTGCGWWACATSTASGRSAVASEFGTRSFTDLDGCSSEVEAVTVAVPTPAHARSRDAGAGAGRPGADGKAAHRFPRRPPTR